MENFEWCSKEFALFSRRRTFDTVEVFYVYIIGLSYSLSKIEFNFLGTKAFSEALL